MDVAKNEMFILVDFVLILVSGDRMMIEWVLIG